ncbi:MAG TPA: 1-(5-phosphoribosyl)-5-[(5-phosphoribosylamino)methylideneamino]imidazole-4-carboxamide isomerase [Spirochaetota bacterium]|nr:1-(5-phosphoribosyl)-5-[(5-phosphoribosylamino)methylideneamino]imidazole-4-carboxamide isomerase [Spirochaetota bacterium]HPG50481.1 1-(5-phosphoribosyl)-5-[(5-phosphoribosylamino)methylideneamino]imidazole-4-carboxamide isomerase [Spirochaetota bacterium]HPN13327.1 1-(5-phosphoribosyl)-5-[(5-phosphoribosylamino)methylideneamino]imidazole-4-carboxamide isomerase [Spirochaetota bacterium]HQL83093.1 1-(5-phosphoribosyl)-5-[(5-phosphoribosylamino)methylideneamino]imidazole-4-carboxamide isomera
MLVIPAIDIKGGNCVRLLQGDPERETVYSSDPVSMAQRFQDAGAKLIHIVDLDGAFSGEPVNMNIVTEIASSVSVPIEIGGGIRTEETIRMYADNGIRRIIIGTMAIDPSFRQVLDRNKDILVAGVDARNSMVATHGWKNVSSVRAIEVIREIESLGIRELIYTDIATDGMLSGPNIQAMRDILTAFPGIGLVASGGISSLDDISNLAELESYGLKGCITGKALYDGRIDLWEAISRFG